jgi:hypothetical protein
VPVDLGPSARAELDHLVPIGSLERQHRKLRQAQRVDLGREDRRVARALLERARRLFAILEEVARHAPEEAGERPTGAAGRLELVGPSGVLVHPRRALGGERGTHQRAAHLDGAAGAGGPRCARRERRPVLHEVALPPHQLAPGRREREPGLAGDVGLGEPAQPSLHRAGLAARDRCGDIAPDEVAGGAHLSCGQGMVHGAIGIPRGSVPRARAAVELPLELRLVAAEVRAQRFLHQAVVAVPLAGPVDGEDEAIARQRLEHGGRVAPIQHRVAQRAAERVHDGGPDDECPRVVGQVAQHLVAHVVRYEPVGAAEAREVRAAATVTEIQRGQGQPERPSLRPLEQRVERVGVELVAGVGEEPGRFHSCHGEVARTELGHEPLRSHPRHGQRKLSARGDREPGKRREVVRDGGERVESGSPVQRMGIVDDEDEGRVRVVPHGRGHRAGDRAAEPFAVVVALVDGDPRERALVPPRPVAQQGGLPVSRGRDEHGQRGRRRVREPLHQGGAAHDAVDRVRARAPHAERRLDRLDHERCCHAASISAPRESQQGRVPARRGTGWHEGTRACNRHRAIAAFTARSRRITHF